MPVSDDFRQFVVDQMSVVVPVSAKRMFGGFGLYADGLFFGVIDDNRVFLRTGPGNVADFVDLGCAQFQPIPDARPMSYHELPGEVLESRSKLRSWLPKAVEEARSARLKKPKEKTAKTKGASDSATGLSIPRKRHRAGR